MNPLALNPTRGWFLMKVEDKPDVVNGVHLAGETEASDLGTAIKIGLPGDFPPEFKEGDKVMIAKFSGRRHMDEEGNSYLVLPQSEVIAYE